VQVVTSGTEDVMVSTAGGDIHAGDYITASSIAGVGQKVTSPARVIGTAAVAFDGSGSGVTRRSINDGTSKKEVAIGLISVVISVSSYSTEAPCLRSSFPLDAGVFQYCGGKAGSQSGCSPPANPYRGYGKRNRIAILGRSE